MQSGTQGLIGTRPRQARMEESGSKGVTGAGRVDDLGRLSRQTNRLTPTGPHRSGRSSLEGDFSVAPCQRPGNLDRISETGEDLPLLQIGKQEVRAPRALQKGVRSHLADKGRRGGIDGDRHAVLPGQPAGQFQGPRTVDKAVPAVMEPGTRLKEGRGNI